MRLLSECPHFAFRSFASIDLNASSRRVDTNVSEFSHYMELKHLQGCIRQGKCCHSSEGASRGSTLTNTSRGCISTGHSKCYALDGVLNILLMKIRSSFLVRDGNRPVNLQISSDEVVRQTLGKLHSAQIPTGTISDSPEFQRRSRVHDASAFDRYRPS